MYYLRIAKADHIGRMSRDDILVLRVLRLQDTKQGLDCRRMQKTVDLVDDEDSFVDGHNCRQQRDNLGDARAAGVERKAQLHPLHRLGRPDAHSRGPLGAVLTLRLPTVEKISWR